MQEFVLLAYSLHQN